MLIKFNNGLDISSSLSESAKTHLLEIFVWTVDPKVQKSLAIQGNVVTRRLAPKLFPPSRFAPGRYASILQSTVSFFRKWLRLQVQTLLLTLELAVQEFD